MDDLRIPVRTTLFYWCFKEGVQKNGILAVKSDGHGNTTVYMFCDATRACSGRHRPEHKVDLMDDWKFLSERPCVLTP